MGSTKDRILEAACPLFSEHGFDETTHQDIARKADANSALINYHFGTKEKLYFSCWEYAYGKVLEKYGEPFDQTISVEDQLKGYLEMKVRSLFDNNSSGWFTKLIHKEMKCISPMLKELRIKYLFPNVQAMEKCVRSMVDETISDQSIRSTVLAIHSQYVMLNASPFANSYVFETEVPTDKQVDDYASFLIDFAFSTISRLSERGDV